MDYGMPYLIDCGSPEACASLCRELGLSFVELNASFPSCTMQSLSADRLNRIRKETGVYFTLHLDEMLQPCAFDDDVRNAYLQCTLNAIKLARACGVPTINLHWERGVYITLPGRKIFMNEVYREDYLRRTRDFRDACAEATGDGLRLSIENTNGWLPYQQESIDLLLQSPCFGLTLDIGHSHAIEDTDLAFYARHPGRLCHMHAHDALGDHPHLAFGDGEIDLKNRLAMAREANARVVLEVKTPEALRRTVELLPSYDPLYRKE